MLFTFSIYVLFFALIYLLTCYLLLVSMYSVPNVQTGASIVFVKRVKTVLVRHTCSENMQIANVINGLIAVFSQNVLQCFLLCFL